MTQALVEKFKKEGGVFIFPDDNDLRTFLALRDIQAKKPEGFEAWLQSRKPLCGTAFFKQVGLCPPPMRAADQAQGAAPSLEGASDAASGGKQIPSPSNEGRAAGAIATAGPAGTSSSTVAEDPSRPISRAIPIGQRIEGGGPGRLETLSAELLPRHTAIFAGSGSGKTVLLRRIVEEAALLGIPAIVLDTNNDLARLGDPWPQRPDAFSDEDAEKARRYRDHVEVVVWTPNLTSGRPL
ncbi:MAG: DUF87 domain-containing protein, partial [Acetobacteraceae bacterium]|nr:DUF87 domain-containing protein [Acetobacteraceae bacterium]